ncbi:TPA: hypothetical protein ACMU2U_001369 [Clostridioides difficile]|nr:hypothetical protein [Clostridioides difficile]MCI4304724.1 hypothetical protein [Clostridioides difficile]MCM4101621.1 hypothetical protein [Clostridioides difficile]
MINNIGKFVSVVMIQFVTLLLIAYYFGGLKYTLALSVFMIFSSVLIIVKTSLNRDY